MTTTQRQIADRLKACETYKIIKREMCVTEKTIAAVARHIGLRKPPGRKARQHNGVMHDDTSPYKNCPPWVCPMCDHRVSVTPCIVCGSRHGIIRTGDKWRIAWRAR